MQNTNTTQLELMLQNNQQLAYCLLDLFQNASSIEDSLAMITPAIDFTGCDSAQISETLYNIECIRKTLRMAENPK